MIAHLYKPDAPGHSHGNDVYLGTVVIPDTRARPDRLRVVEETNGRVTRNFKRRGSATEPNRYVEVSPDEQVGENLVTVSVDEITPPTVYDAARSERERCRRVLAHHDRLALARTAGYAGSVPNLVSLALRAAASDVATGKDYPA